jgi:hypothetical protein
MVGGLFVIAENYVEYSTFRKAWFVDYLNVTKNYILLSVKKFIFSQKRSAVHITESTEILMKSFARARVF